MVAPEVNLALAKSLGLPLDNLMRFTLTVAPGALPVVHAAYCVRTAVAMEQVVRAFRMVPMSPQQKVRDAA